MPLSAIALNCSLKRSDTGWTLPPSSAADRVGVAEAGGAE